MKNKCINICSIVFLCFFCFNIVFSQNTKEKPLWVRTGHDGFGSLAGLNEGIPTKNWKYFISTAGDGVIRFVNPESGEFVKLWEVDFAEFENRTGVFVDIATSPDEKYLCTNSMRIWSIEGDTIVKKLQPGGKYVASPQFSNDGQFVAAAVWPEDKKSSVLKVWNMSNSNIQSQLAHSSAISKLAFMHQSNTIVFVDNSGGLYTWDMNMAGAQKIAQTFALPNEFDGHSFTLAPNDRFVLLADADATLTELWDLQLKSRKYRWTDAYAPKKMAFSPDSRYCAVESPGSGITVKSVETGLPVNKLRITLRFPNYMYFSPDGKKLIAVDVSSGLAEVLDIEKNEPVIRLLSHSSSIRDISVNKELFVTTQDDGYEGAAVQLFENDGKSVRWRASYKTQIYGSDDDARYMRFEAAALSPDNSYVAIIADTDPLKKESRGIIVLDAKNGSVVSAFPAHQSEITKIIFSPDGKTLFSSSRDSTIKVWNVSNGILKRTVEIMVPVYGMIVSGDTLFALASSDFERKIVKINIKNNTQSEVSLNAMLFQTRNSSKIAFSPNGSQLAITSGWNTISIWNTSTGYYDVEFDILNKNNSNIESLSFSPDGNMLIIGCNNNMIQVVNPKATEITNEFIKIISPDFPFSPSMTSPGELRAPIYTTAAFSADGKTFFAGTSDANLIKVSAPLITSVENNSHEMVFTESNIYPNPTSTTITVPFLLKSDALVSLCVFNSNGDKIDCILQHQKLVSGEYVKDYSVEQLPNGVYYYELQINNSTQHYKFSVIR